MKRLLVLSFLIVTLAVPARAEELTIYNNFSNDSVKITIPEYKPIATTPIVKNSYYNAYPKLEDVIKGRKIDYFNHVAVINIQKLAVEYNQNGQIISIGKIKFEYNDDGTYNKINGQKVIYNEKGQIKKIGHRKVTYNNNGQIEKIGTTTIYYDKYNGISGMRSPFNNYKAIYKCTDNLRLDMLYRKILTDDFFNNYKYSLKKYQSYDGLESVKSCKNTEAISDINHYLNQIKKFNNYYNDYKENIGWHSQEYYTWFLRQVEIIETWMKTHSVDYINPYEEDYKQKAAKTREEIVEEEYEEFKRRFLEGEKARRQQQEEAKRQEELREQVQKIIKENFRYINGKRVEYGSDGRIYIND